MCRTSSGATTTSRLSAIMRETSSPFITASHLPISCASKTMSRCTALTLRKPCLWRRTRACVSGKKNVDHVRATFIIRIKGLGGSVKRCFDLLVLHCS
jgi:hypothetical protein